MVVLIGLLLCARAAKFFARRLPAIASKVVASHSTSVAIAWIAILPVVTAGSGFYFVAAYAIKGKHTIVSHCRCVGRGGITRNIAAPCRTTGTLEVVIVRTF